MTLVKILKNLEVLCPDPESDSAPKLYCHVNTSNNHFLSCDVDCERNLKIVILNNTMLYRICELSKNATPLTACWILVRSRIWISFCVYFINAMGNYAEFEDLLVLYGCVINCPTILLLPLVVLCICWAWLDGSGSGSYVVTIKCWLGLESLEGFFTPVSASISSCCLSRDGCLDSSVIVSPGISLLTAGFPKSEHSKRTWADIATVLSSLFRPV